MFSEVHGQLTNSKVNFSERVNDSFGHAIVRDVYDPFETEIQGLGFAWEEAKTRKAEIMALLTELRCIL
ncbi:hypothetical protein [uncultured Megasphaera sp.]|uniref:hypothetical protein n=1 Tax=Megasphaera massiliensis TaxID=1232428 RepID=UPI00266BB15A|nr:hypothetical protein [uncultured Megasphaera sp.]